MKLIISALGDLIIRYLPNFRKDEYAYAFLVHPRDIKDVYRKYPFLRFFSEKSVLFFLEKLWPITVSEITGLKDVNGNLVKGYVISIPIITHQIMENRSLALKKIINSLKLAEKKGVKIAGLGALISSVTKGGLDLIDKTNIKITTGHAYTAYNVTLNLFELEKIFNISKEDVIVAIVGATGSIGSTSAKLIARKGYKKIMLFDVERKSHLFDRLIKEIKSINNDVIITTSHQIKDVKSADFIITATNAPEAVIKSEDLKAGAVVIDDAQPSDVAEDVLEREDVLVLEAGVVYTPNITANFNFGLKSKYDNFCCLCEVMILAHKKWNDHYVINRANLNLVDEISEEGKKLGFKLGEFQNFKEVISWDKITKIKNIIEKNHNQNA